MVGKGGKGRQRAGKRKRAGKGSKGRTYLRNNSIISNYWFLSCGRLNNEQNYVLPATERDFLLSLQ